MIDIKLIREREAELRLALKNRGSSVDLNALQDVDRQRREQLAESELHLFGVRAELHTPIAKD